VRALQQMEEDHADSRHQSSSPKRPQYLPDSNQKESSQSPVASQSKTCFNCGEPGHLANNSPQKEKKPKLDSDSKGTFVDTPSDF
jgi:hypothetical protein